MSVASVSNLTVRYGTRTALTELSVEIPEGCVGLLGPNGAGKSTLIKTLLGFVRPASGTGEVFGYDVMREPLRVRQQIGLMPEQDCHIPGMNAVTFVAYAGELAGMSAKDALRRAHEVLEYAGLGEARYRNVETYSTGMKQRIKLAQALVHGPRLLFLDEPTNGLDPAGREEMLHLIRDISHAKGVNVVVSSHLLPDIERTCDQVIVMRAGRVVQHGAIATLRQTRGTQIDVELRVASEPFLEAIRVRGGTVLYQTGSRCRLLFSDPLPDPGRLLFEAAAASGAQLRGFRPSARTLEDIFLEAMEEP
ncbi:MAG: ABC transporter ATP-binding protein [Chloroherpetonaceae bacterium]|nr:ABC transporter ATP-binding protein [Chthonomonadaceae bacterium]MDW8207032.1 ABC transporter ATP-binding protein [Chloroherpetonaceae bacterium]